jgi:hypothetical protein
VIERRHQDLVAGLELAPGRAGEREVERGHVGAEDHLLRSAAKKAGGLQLSLLEDLPNPHAGRVGRAEIGARLPKAPRHRLANLIRHLRPTGRIEEHKVAL